MKVIQADMWTIDCDAVCITTNEAVKSDGSAVMGRGCALQARERFKGLDKILGTLIKENGNIVQPLINYGKWLTSFPTNNCTAEELRQKIQKGEYENISVDTKNS